MRFPFFATNEELKVAHDRINLHANNLTAVSNKTHERIADLEQKVLVLEGEINKLKGDEKRGRQKKGN